MTDPSAATQASAATTPANKGVKQGLPPTGLPAAEEAVMKLWEVARRGTATAEAFARQFGDNAKPSGGGWDTRMSLLRGFKLIRKEGAQLGLTELGLKLIDASDPAGQTDARRAAVMNLRAYQELVEAFDGTPLPDKGVLATRLQFEYGKAESFAQRAAQAFIDSLRHAEMLSDTDVVRKGGATTANAEELPGESNFAVDPEDLTVEDKAEAAEIDRAFESNENEAISLTYGTPDDGTVPIIGRAQPASIAVTLDLSNFTADEIITILAALGHRAPA